MSGDSERKVATEVLALCRARNFKIATAESCTGGLVAAALTAIAGSSDVVDRGFVTYSNAAKSELLAVPAALLMSHGAVSAEVAAAMADGVLAHAPVELAVSVTGIAGPGGGSADKPVGLVYFGVARRGSATGTERKLFAGDRAAIRRAATSRALELLDAAARS